MNHSTHTQRLRITLQLLGLLCTLLLAACTQPESTPIPPTNTPQPTLEPRSASVLDVGSPIPLPPQDIIAACQDDEGNSALYLFDTVRNTWTVGQALGQGIHYATYLTGQSSLLIERTSDTLWGQEELLLLNQDQRTSIVDQLDSAEIKSAWPVRISPNQQQLLLNGNHLINLAACNDGNCQANTLAGSPTWSPSGTHTLITAAGPTLSVADPAGAIQAEVGIGKSPIWLNNNEFVFLGVGQSGVEIGKANRSNPTSISYVLAPSQLIDALPADVAPPNRIVINEIAASPNTPQHLYIAASTLEFISSPWDQGPFYLFKWDSDANIVTYIDQMLPAPASFQFSPDGTWLGIQTVGNDGGSPTIYLHDLVNRTVQTYSADLLYVSPIYWQGAWSKDGEWFTVAGNGQIQLHAPGYDHQIDLKQPANTTCASAFFTPMP